MSKPAGIFLMLVAPALSLFLALLGLETLRENRLGWFLFILGIAFPAARVIYYFIRHEPVRRKNPSDVAAQEGSTDKSFWAILPGFLVIFFAPPLDWYYLPELLPRTLPFEIAGAALILIGATLAGWAIVYLREYYSAKISVGKSQVLLQSGPYRVIRHPSYLGMLLIGVGVALGYASLLGLLAAPLLLIPGLIYRISVEERLLQGRFGAEYSSYQKRTKRLIPGVW